MTEADSSDATASDGTELPEAEEDDTVEHDAGGAVRETGARERPPAEVAELAASLAEYVRRAVGIAVDGTPETLPLVDHYVSLVRQERARRPEVLSLVAPAVGAYFGEVLRAAIAAFWRVPSADVHRWRICAERVLVAVNPVGIAYDVLFQGEEHDGPSAEVELGAEDRALVAPRLEALPSVSEAEYYLLSTRLEVLEIIVDALAARLPEGARDLELEWEDYAGIVGVE